MTPDEVRERFSEAFEGDLDEQAKSAFDEALDSDSDLRAEYDDFVETLRMMGRIGQADEDVAPDMVGRVQDRIRRRSRGRYYRDRFSRQRANPAWVLPLLIAMMVLLFGALSWMLLDPSVIIDEELMSEPESTTEP